ncbi:MAG: helix-turn-helix domain-containing protein [Candidatus Methanofastidiosia archaeon]|jgi:sugar-specific transcriptional regulator TrmB
MTEEDLKQEIKQLKNEIEQLKSKKEEERDERILRALQWFNMGEAKAKAYVYLVKKGKATAEDVAKGAGLYPTTAREVLTELSERGIVLRDKLDTEGAGRKPFVYTAIPPSELLKKQVHTIEKTLSELMRLEFWKKNGEIKFKAPFLPIRIEIKGLKTEKEEPKK